MGAVYDDAFDDDAGEYHFPKTRRPGTRDRGEIEATKNASRLQLPVFVVLASASPERKEVRLGWIEEWDDTRAVFLISFRRLVPVGAAPIESPFALTQKRAAAKPSLSRPRPGQNRFRFEVIRRYGSACALCGLSVDVLLEAIHICPVADGGSDDSRNGLVLCRNHHRAFDAHFFAFDPRI